MFESYADHYDGAARLTILKTLEEQSDGRINDSLLTTILQGFGFNKTRDYVRTQIAWLRDQGHAVTTKEMGSAWVVELTEQGEDHLARRVKIEGVNQPALKRG
ncbi:MAG: hypothetical protein AAF317_00035 [Pseudomonadota bacterium]